MRIALIGFMGAGKTSVAKILGERLQLRVLELDDLIVARAGGRDVPEVFAALGEDGFRALESEVVAAAAAEDQVVISCGGGVVKNSMNVALLKASGAVVVFLEAALESIFGRVSFEDRTRPLFSDPVRVAELYRERLPLYRKVSDYVVSTDGLTPEAVADLIIQDVRSR